MNNVTKLEENEVIDKCDSAERDLRDNILKINFQ